MHSNRLWQKSLLYIYSTYSMHTPDPVCRLSVTFSLISKNTNTCLPRRRGLRDATTLPLQTILLHHCISFHFSFFPFPHPSISSWGKRRDIIMQAWSGGSKYPPFKTHKLKSLSSQQHLLHMFGMWVKTKKVFPSL